MQSLLGCMLTVRGFYNATLPLLVIGFGGHSIWRTRQVNVQKGINKMVKGVAFKKLLGVIIFCNDSFISLASTACKWTVHFTGY